MEFQVAIDRIEGDVAVLLPAGETAARLGPGARFLWPKGLLPEGAGEGTYLRVTAAVDQAATAAAREKVRSLLESFRTPAGGTNPAPEGGRRE